MKSKSGIYFCSREHQGFGFRKNSGTGVTSGPKRIEPNLQPVNTFQCKNCNTPCTTTLKYKTFCSEECKMSYVSNITEKKCFGCEKVKTIADFGRARNHDGFSFYCSSCTSEKWQVWYNDNKELRQAANSINNKEWIITAKGQKSILIKRLNRYGLSLVQYEQMMLESNGSCQICSESEKLVIDHDHKTLMVRGILCRGCNIALGIFKDDTVTLSAAIRYLENNGAVYPHADNV